MKNNKKWDAPYELGEENGTYIDGYQREGDKLPKSDLPLVLGLDGGYVRSTDKKSFAKSNFEVIVGNSIRGCLKRG